MTNETNAQRTRQGFRLIWAFTHPDYRGRIDGEQHLMIHQSTGPDAGTRLVPLKSLSDVEYRNLLTYAESCVARGRKPYRA